MDGLSVLSAHDLQRRWSVMEPHPVSQKRHLQWDVWTKVLDPAKVALSFLQDNRDVLPVWGQIFNLVWLLQSLRWTVDMLGRRFDAGRGSRAALSGWASGCPAVHSFSLRAAKTVKSKSAMESNRLSVILTSSSPPHASRLCYSSLGSFVWGLEWRLVSDPGQAHWASLLGNSSPEIQTKRHVTF